LNIRFWLTAARRYLDLQGQLLLIEALLNILEIVKQKQLLLVYLLQNIAYLFLNSLHINFLFFDGNLELIGAYLEHHVGVHDLQVLHLNAFLALEI
jgi:hypothetical protein